VFSTGRIVKAAGPLEHAPVPLLWSAPRIEPVALSWLITVRWTTLAAGVGAVVAGRGALQMDVPVAAAATTLSFLAGSNLWLMWRARRAGIGSFVTPAGLLVCADVALLTWLLLKSGGVLNPASVVYLVEIVLAALVLGRRWTWIVTGLCVLGYGSLYLAPTAELRDALNMHREIALHMRGMWLAFALTSLTIVILVTRLVISVEHRDRALEDLRERTARAARGAGLATLAAGAAHELSTPLGTIAVASHELERNLSLANAAPELQQDARLIRAEADRCRQVLDAMAGQSGEPIGETPRALTISDVVSGLRGRLTPAEWSRLDVDLPGQVSVVWPLQVIARALENVVRNALQASVETDRVRLSGHADAKGQVQFAVIDQGAGMTAEQLSRAGEPFFTTKPPGVGTGLGLFVARSSIEQLGGSLSLSSAVASGTTVRIVLPVNVVTSR
jgi:two-component system sensor histidine kinase RegB